MRRLGVMLSALVVASGVITVGTPVPVAAETAAISATCEATFYDSGTQAPPLQLPGSFQILGKAPVSSEVGELLVINGVQVRLSVDWDALRPELEARNITHLSVALLAAWLDVTVNGTPDWPSPINDESESIPIPVEQLADTGIMSTVQDVDLGRPAEPSVIRLSSRDEVYFQLRRLEDPQVLLIIKCVADAGQNLRFGQVTIHA